jgi:hypothetical protein
MVKGKWIGYYKYDNRKMQSIVGYERTNFEIEIQSVDGNKFEGIVQDDEKTGGMKGIGVIKGKLIGDRIKFVKQMPIWFGIFPDRTQKYIPNKKHPKIYYTGIISDDKKLVAGEWKFKNLNSFILKIIGTKSLDGGTFEMRLES